eukprot:11208265-Lingulodinium_polyedra.AAC.1
MPGMIFIGNLVVEALHWQSRLEVAFVRFAGAYAWACNHLCQCLQLFRARSLMAYWPVFWRP